MANVKQAKLKCVKGKYGNNFKKLRVNHKMTLIQLGEKIHYSDRTINMIETENREPTIEQLQAYHDFFHVSYDYLLGETDVTDISIQAINEYTGLSESAINFLFKLKEKSEYRAYSDLLSVIITNPKFEYILGLIENCIVSDDKHKITLDSYSIVDLSDRQLATIALNQYIPEWLKQIEKDFLSSYLSTEFKLSVLTLNKLKKKLIEKYENGTISAEDKEKELQNLEAECKTKQREYIEKYERLLKGE